MCRARAQQGSGQPDRSRRGTLRTVADVPVARVQVILIHLSNLTGLQGNYSKRTMVLLVGGLQYLPRTACARPAPFAPLMCPLLL